MSVELELANMSFDIETFKEQLQQREPVTHLRLRTYPYNRSQHELYDNQGNYNLFVNFESTSIFESGIQQDSKPLSSCQYVTTQLKGTSSIQQQYQFCSPIKKVLYAQTQIHLSGSFVKYLANNNLCALQRISEWNCPQLEQVVAYDNRISYIPSLLCTNFNGLRSICFGDQVDQNLLFIGCLLARFINYQNYDQIQLLSDSDTSVD